LGHPENAPFECTFDVLTRLKRVALSE